jgi:hypothetical protein
MGYLREPMIARASFEVSSYDSQVPEGVEGGGVAG